MYPVIEILGYKETIEAWPFKPQPGLNGFVKFDSVLKHCPFCRLQMLNIGHNNLTCLRQTNSTPFSNSNLTTLNLIQNEISRFEDVADLAEIFPNLSTLILSDNPLVSFGEDKEVRFT